MAFTSHGHHIPGSPVEDGPDNCARCGGPRLCHQCALESAVWATANELKTVGLKGNDAVEAAAWATANELKTVGFKSNDHKTEEFSVGESTTAEFFRYKPTSIIQYFKYHHLPPHLMLVSKAYAELAVWTNDNIPEGPEKSVALRKLLEAKDAAVRAALDLF